MGTQSSLPTSIGFNKLKSIGQLQLTHMWRIYFFLPTGMSKLGINVTQSDLEMISLVARTFDLPALTRSYIKMRMNDREYIVPAGQTTSHEISIDLLNDEKVTVFGIIYRWYTAIPKIVSQLSLADAKSNLVFYSLSMDGARINKAFEITGMLPLEVPQIGNWNYDSESEHSKMTVKFGFDDIVYYDNRFSYRDGTLIE